MYFIFGIKNPNLKPQVDVATKIVKPKTEIK